MSDRGRHVCCWTALRDSPIPFRQVGDTSSSLGFGATIGAIYKTRVASSDEKAASRLEVSY